MLTSSRRRFLGLAASGLAVAALVRRAAALDDPVAFAEVLYALPGLWSDVIDDLDRYVVPEFAKEILDNENLGGDDLDYAVDYEPLTNSQEWELKDLKFAEEKSTDDTATVRADFVSYGEPTTILLDMRVTANGWRLADVRTPDGHSLFAEYKKLNDNARAAGKG